MYTDWNAELEGMEWNEGRIRPLTLNIKDAMRV